MYVTLAQIEQNVTSNSIRKYQLVTLNSGLLRKISILTQNWHKTERRHNKNVAGSSSSRQYKIMDPGQAAHRNLYLFMIIEFDSRDWRNACP